jgi:hypothetical protein
VKKLELDPEKIVMPLLGQVRQYDEMKDAPEGKKNCEDCEKINELIQQIGRV